MSTSAAITANTLHAAAFGSDPGMWPLPAATTAGETWLRAVAAGGQGRYASALADVDRLRRSPVPDALLSLALSTRASFLRQLGWHDRARAWDGQAAALASDGDAGADALIGLAADALGVGRFAASERALARAADVLASSEADSASPRLPVRLAWVSAELAMFRGDGGGAVGHAVRGVELAAGAGSVRHAVKSRVVLAAALCSAGDLDASRREAGGAMDEAGRYGLIPLRWAAASLLADIGAEDLSPTRIAGIRDQSAEAVVRWGGVWRPW
jgi:hypothetical protein